MARLFQGLYVVTVEDTALMAFLAGASGNGIEAAQLGRTIARRIVFELDQGDFCVTLDDLRAAHEGFFPALMA